jgi:hypothetical protein
LFNTTVTGHGTLLTERASHYTRALPLSNEIHNIKKYEVKHDRFACHTARIPTRSTPATEKLPTEYGEDQVRENRYEV